MRTRCARSTLVSEVHRDWEVKEKRSDCKLPILALVVDECGFAKYSRLYPGDQEIWETHGMLTRWKGPSAP
jgi:hypothetical protein